jgi:GntR family transcriptional regulator
MSRDRAPDPAHALKPLYVRLRDDLRGQILDGRLAPLARLPSEHALTARHGVSRITVRQALNDLQKEGLIVRVHGKGSFVSRPRVAEDVTRLQGLAEAMSRDGHEVHNRALSVRDVPAAGPVAERLGVPAKTIVTELATLRYLDREPISLNVSHVPKPIGDRLRKARHAGRDFIDILENDLALALGHADVEIDAQTADPRLAAALKVKRGSPVLHVQRVVFTRSGEAVLLESIRYRGDAFRYRFRIERASSVADT